MKLLQPSTASALLQSVRGAKDIFIGANVQLRKELACQQLSGVKVAILHGNGGRALLISKVLQDHGAQLEHFSLKGEKSPNFERIRQLEQDKDKSYFENVLRKTDVFVDGVGCEKMGLKATELAKKNAKLIITSVDCKEPFAAMNVMKAICAGLYLRETTGGGQVLPALDSKGYEKELRDFAKQLS